ncbi:MAG: hypothetical protein A2202_05115 [Bdellovibrionales bacterium RIFOXYA1_FULL_36_14]|nr:MAG: hypothetical protein A2202_05115 [Bdellovibrionales bacterium RIFOXYA1_FULL_36_14]
MGKFLRQLNMLIIIFSLMIACNPTTGERSNKASHNQVINANGKPAGGTGAAPGENGGGTISGTGAVVQQGEAEIKHLIDPFDGTYKTKLTLPKNFTGRLYISGLNISSLTDKIVHVRFSFGRELEPIVIEASVGRAPGIVPQTDIEVLILNILDKPFEKIRLLYDLFDYSDYRDNSGNEFGSNLDVGESITLNKDPRSTDLYCRGLKLEHDHTFVPTLDRPLCNYSGARCLYAYAKISDTGLYNQAGEAINPSEAQLDLSKKGYANESQDNNLKKCLPDNNSRDNLRDVLGVTDLSFNGSGFGVDITFPNNAVYEYRGPYRAINPKDWEIKGNALWGSVSSSQSASSLFTSSFGNATGDLFKDYVGYGAFLFPRVGNLNLASNVDHFSSETPLSVRSKTSLLSGGDTDYVDGCNVRMLEYNSYANEGIVSCNVTAKIEIINIDQNTGDETVLASSTDLKLQLIRESMKDYLGKEVLFTSMKKCTSSSACGNGECCYNDRCWDKTLVSRCLEDVSSTGNGQTGDLCSSDYECASLCCNRATSSCQVHTNREDPPVLCNKPTGQTCVAREWCQIHYINECKLYKTGTSTTGQQLCGIRCYQKPTFGLCKNGLCATPPTPAVPVLADPDNPDCSKALDVPTEFSSI